MRREPERVVKVRRIDRRADDGNVVRCKSLDASPETDNACIGDPGKQRPDRSGAIGHVGVVDHGTFMRHIQVRHMRTTNDDRAVLHLLE